MWSSHFIIIDYDSNLMKFTAALMLAAVFFLDSGVEAKRSRRVGSDSEEKREKPSGTFAVCGSKPTREEWEAGAVGGKTSFW